MFKTGMEDYYRCQQLEHENEKLKQQNARLVEALKHLLPNTNHYYSACYGEHNFKVVFKKEIDLLKEIADCCEIIKDTLEDESEGAG
jgi:hypothetical protein